MFSHFLLDNLIVTLLSAERTPFYKSSVMPTHILNKPGVFECCGLLKVAKNRHLGSIWYLMFKLVSYVCSSCIFFISFSLFQKHCVTGICEWCYLNKLYLLISWRDASCKCSILLNGKSLEFLSQRVPYKP